jgi:hypothetical protein
LCALDRVGRDGPLGVGIELALAPETFIESIE